MDRPGMRAGGRETKRESEPRDFGCKFAVWNQRAEFLDEALNRP